LSRVDACEDCGTSGVENGLEQVSGKSVEDVAVLHRSRPFLAEDRQALGAVSCCFERVVVEERAIAPDAVDQGETGYEARVQRNHRVCESSVLVEAFVGCADRRRRLCAGDETWVGSFQGWQKDCEQGEDCLVVLPARKLVKVEHCGAVSLNLHSVEVTSIKVSALRVVHPCALVSIFRSLRASSHPVVQIRSNRSHLPVKFGTLLGCSFEDVPVNAEDRLVGPRVDLIEFNHVYVRRDV
jgi:hypothetical protein